MSGRERGVCEVPTYAISRTLDLIVQRCLLGVACRYALYYVQKQRQEAEMRVAAEWNLAEKR